MRKQNLTHLLPHHIILSFTAELTYLSSIILTVYNVMAFKREKQRKIPKVFCLRIPSKFFCK
jgi:hypothetical protein